jgi:hypothetical protein
MSRHRRSIPSYLDHKQSGKARAVWTDQTGNRQFRILSGPLESQETRSAVARLQLELAAVPYRSPIRADNVVTVNEVLVALLEWADGHYRRAKGPTTDEIGEYTEGSTLCPRSVRSENVFENSGNVVKPPFGIRVPDGGP